MPRLTYQTFLSFADSAAEKMSAPGKSGKMTVTVHMGTCGIAAGAQKIKDALLEDLAERNGHAVQVGTSGCAGLCSREPMLTIRQGENPPVVYIDLTVKKLKKIVDEHIRKGHVVSEYTLPAERKKDFYDSQQTVVFQNRGRIDPENIEEYIALGGYQAARKALKEMKSGQIIKEIQDSGLRGRGGAGFPTGKKWALCAQAKGDTKYIICNGDEGDPGAYMDRSIIESDPHSLIEGMIIGAKAIGASHGFVYLRSEYPLAQKTLNHAIEAAREYGLLGEDCLGTGFNFDLSIHRGAGAFVCGEETSLIASIEGRPPEPGLRPPYPVEKGLWGCPTNINNVETWANVPRIIQNGAAWYAGIGTESSKGTKVFSIVGDVQNAGLVEIPMGITLKEIIYTIGGGIPKNRAFKAVQTGGPSGGCIPESKIDLPIDYERLQEAGSIMGSGGMIVMDERTCMVDVARYFLDFLRDESCGKCTSCREGIQTMYQITTRICEGNGRPDDVDLLIEIAEAVKAASLCGLGTTAPNPVLSTLQYFRDEYDAHVFEKKCPAGSCKALIQYSIDAGKCTGCAVCKKGCPVDAISGEVKQTHLLDQEPCIKCGACYEVCQFDAIVIE